MKTKKFKKKNSKKNSKTEIKYLSKDVRKSQKNDLPRSRRPFDFISSTFLARFPSRGLQPQGKRGLSHHSLAKTPSTQWSYLDFLKSNRSEIIVLPPFSTDWTGLDD